ncbi:MAG: hypothetical protein F7C34_05285 [Desulfurococcales archaeon]|nr:hypothetical protein [Desulfurococcales archaeon]
MSRAGGEEDTSNCISVVDLIRELRAKTVEEGEELIEYAKKLGVKNMEEAKRIALQYIYYQIEYDEAKRMIEELARSNRQQSYLSCFL